jgi:hypothetical protein
MGNEPIYTVRLAGGVGNVMAGPPSSAPSRRSRGRRIVTSMKKRNLFAGYNSPRGLARPRPLGNRSRHPRPASGSANGIRSPGPNVRRRSSAPASSQSSPKAPTSSPPKPPLRLFSISGSPTLSHKSRRARTSATRRSRERTSFHCSVRPS